METWIDTKDARLWTRRTGTGSIPILLISGGPGAADYMDEVAELLAEHFTIVQFDPRGCGRSIGNSTHYTLADCLQEMERIRTYYGFHQWFVVGHSWGADVGLAYALAHPSVLSGFVSLAGTGIQNDRDWKDAYVSNKEVQGEEQPDFLYPTNKEVHRHLLSSWRTFIKTPDLFKRLSTLQIPTLFVVAGNDIRPSWPIQQLAQLIPAAEYQEIKEAGHYIWLHQPNLLKKILVNFITAQEEETTHEHHHL